MRSLPQYVTLKVYDTNYHPWDMLYLKFDEASTNAEDDDDANKPSGGDLRFYSLFAKQSSTGCGYQAIQTR